MYSFTNAAVIILVKYFGKLIYESDERKKWAERENIYIVSYTKLAEISIYPWLDYVIYIMLESDSITIRL